MPVVRPVSVRAHAKINLTLRVGPVGADGYHPLETVFQTLALHDVIVAEASRGGFSLTCDDAHVPVGRDNLVWRAAEALWRRAGQRGAPRGATVSIRKRIPMQAGLGGGSSDAAAALVALNVLWRFGLDAGALAEIGRGLGADVPSFLVGGTSLGLGRGDDVYPLADASPLHVALVFPPFGVATREAYAWLDADRASGARAAAGAGAVDLWSARPLELGNDLAGPVARRHPQIGSLGRVLRRAGAIAAQMTGSGSTVYGLFPSLAAARRGAEAAAGTGDAWSLVTRFAGRRRAAPLP